MVKRIEDYLYLYPFQDIKIVSETPVIYTDENGHTCSLHAKKIVRSPDPYMVLFDLPKYSFKLLLRPLSDMNPIEKMQLIRICHPEKEYPIITDIDLVNGVLHFLAKTQKMKHSTIFACGFGGTWHPDETLYLLKQGFDLFGLIGANLAEDKTIYL